MEFGRITIFFFNCVLTDNSDSRKTEKHVMPYSETSSFHCSPFYPKLILFVGICIKCCHYGIEIKTCVGYGTCVTRRISDNTECGIFSWGCMWPRPGQTHTFFPHAIWQSGNSLIVCGYSITFDVQILVGKRNLLLKIKIYCTWTFKFRRIPKAKTVFLHQQMFLSVLRPKVTVFIMTI